VVLRTGIPKIRLALLAASLATTALLVGCADDEPVPITFNIGGETVEPTPLGTYTLEPEAPATAEPADG